MQFFYIPVLEARAHYRFTFHVMKLYLPAVQQATRGRSRRTRSKNMMSTKMSGFFKSEECPSSNELLEYQKGEVPIGKYGSIRRHLSSCDFCSAEVEFYIHFPQEEFAAEPEDVEIPAPLFQLAEALLKRRHIDMGALDLLLMQNEELIADGV